MKKWHYAAACLLCCLTVSFYADVYSSAHEENTFTVRIPIWVFLEPQPGVMADDEQGEKMPPRKALTTVAARLLSGMVYGWKFSYTPADRLCNIVEEFTLSPIYTIGLEDTRLSITELRPCYPYLYCWAEYHTNETAANRRKQWQSGVYITSQGRGRADRKLETEGIFIAYEQAIRSAIRNYLQKAEKNKPKQVMGELLIKDNPRLHARSGQFIADISIYLHIQEIIPYAAF